MSMLPGMSSSSPSATPKVRASASALEQSDRDAPEKLSREERRERMRKYKKCIRCKEWKPREADPITGERAGFGSHNTSDGLQSICHECKNSMAKGARIKNPRVHIRHHTSTRCLTQLGDLAPEGFVRDMEQYLGYRIAQLVRHLREDLREREGARRSLRDALQEGYHIDHIVPLHSFRVIRSAGGVDWEEFRRCWAIENLRAIPAQENLKKGGKMGIEVDLSQVDNLD